MPKDPSDKVYRLIRSLSIPEKRYFRIYIRGKTDKEAKYLQLFELLARLPEYDSERVKAVIYPDKSEGKKYPELKAYLFDLILEALRSFDEKHSVENAVTHWLQGVTSLYRRAHYRECDELLGKALKVAIRYELFGAQLEVYRWKRHLAYTRMDVQFLHTQLEVLDCEESLSLARLNNLAAYRSAFFHIYALIKKEAFQRDPNRIQQLDAMLPASLFSGPEQALSIRARIAYYRTVNLYHYAAQQMDQFYDSGCVLIALIEANRPFLAENQSEYIAALFNHIIACGIRQDYEAVRATLDKLRNIVPRTEDDRRKIHRQYYSSLFVLCQFTGAFEEGRAAVRRCREEAISLQYTDYETSSFYWQYMIIAFGCGDYQEALDYLQLWQAQPRSVEREDLQSLARILALILHYELGNYLLLESLIRSAKRFLRQKNRLYVLERRFIQMMGQLMKSAGEGKEQQIIRLMYNQWDNLPGASIIAQVFDLKAWMEARMEDKEYAKVVAERYRQRH